MSGDGVFFYSSQSKLAAGTAGLDLHGVFHRHGVDQRLGLAAQAEFLVHGGHDAGGILFFLDDIVIRI